MTVAESVAHEKIHVLYNDHHNWLQGWLRKKLGCSENAADLTQDTFVRIISASSRCDDVLAIREPRSYLATIARRVMVDYFRRQRLERAWEEALANLPEAEDISPEMRLLVIETLYEIDVMLDGLGHNVRQAFLMSQLEGLSYAAIAEQLSVSVSSVKKYMARATEQCLLFALDNTDS